MIEIKNISKKVGKKKILDNVSLKIEEGSFVILMDEPFSALDSITRTQLQEWLYSL